VITVASCYSGAGGLDLGFAMAGYGIAWSNDSDPRATEIHRRLFPKACHDTGDFQVTSVPPCDVIIGGPPCQSFSVAGKQDPGDERSYCVLDFAAAVLRAQPRAFVMENVPALAGSRHRDFFRELWTLLGGHYFLTSAVLNAADYGVAQDRFRLFLAGFRRDGDYGADDFTAALVRQRSRLPCRTARSVLSIMPAYGKPGNRIKAESKITLAKNPVLRKSPYAGMLLNGGRPLNLDKPAYTLPAIMGGNKTPVIDTGPQESPAWIERYHRALACEDRQFLRHAGDDLRRGAVPVRRITAEEAAALQSFPRGVPWDAVPPSAAFRLIGNAVPPLLAQAVAMAVREAMGSAV
jgi:DNA (cytosine-5)-methyltransferase 1